MEALIDRAADFAARVVALLESIEWQGDSVFFTCPKCGVDKARGHEANCELAGVLASAKEGRQ